MAGNAPAMLSGSSLPQAPQFPNVPETSVPDVGSPADATLQQMGQAQPSAPAAPAKPAAPAVTNPFEGIVRGALMGMGMASLNKNDFFGGMGRAELAQQQVKQQQVENQQKQEQLDIQQKMAEGQIEKNTAQAQLYRANSAKSIIDLLHTEQMMRMAPQDQQIKVQKVLADIQSAYLKAGYQGTEIDDTPNARTAYLQQMQKDGQDIGNVVFTADPGNGKIMAFRPDPTKLIKPEDANNVAAQLGMKGVNFTQPVDPRVFSSLTSGAVRQMTTKMVQDAENQRAAAANATRLSAAEISAHGKGLIDPNTPEGQSLVDSIGTAKVPLTKFEYVATRNPDLLAAVTQKYHDFNGGKVTAFVDALKDFTAGKTSVALNAGSTALGHLYNLAQLAEDKRSYIPGTQHRAQYENLLNQVSKELAQFYGNSTVSGIRSYHDQLSSPYPPNRMAQIRQQAQALGVKYDSFKQQWANAVPSPAYTGLMPDLSPKAKQALAALDPSHPLSAPVQVNNGNPYRQQQQSAAPAQQ